MGCFYFGGSGWIRTSSGLSQQIYSLPRLSNSGARPILGAGSGNRTRISSLEGLHTSLCTMPATKSKPNDYIINEIKIKSLFIENKNSHNTAYDRCDKNRHTCAGRGDKSFVLSSFPRRRESNASQTVILLSLRGNGYPPAWV